jgi:glutamate synthase domain-containing protein 3
MTDGLVVVLGRTGVNFAAGMSGGIAFVLDEDQLFDTMCNLEMVDIEPLTQAKDRRLLKEIVERHVMYTRSEHATRLLRDWDEVMPRFVKVMPIDYRKALERIAKDTSKETESVGMTEEVYR